MENLANRLDATEENHRGTAVDVTSRTSMAAERERDLVCGLVDDVVLGEVIPRLSEAMPRDTRPVLRLLSRSWANAMTDHTPLLYDRVYNAAAIVSPGEFIVLRVFACPHEFKWGHDCHSMRCASESRLCVWNLSRGMENALPPPPKAPFGSVFVCDGENLYLFTPGVVTREEPKVRHKVYKVWMLNLREFNVVWKRLPRLPRLGDYIYASTTSEGHRYIWQRRGNHSSEASVWKLSRESDWQWQHVNINTQLPRNLILDKSNRLPTYIELNRRINNELVYKSVYRRCPDPDDLFPDEFILNGRRPSPSENDDYIFMLSNADSDESQLLIYGDLYRFHVEKNRNDELLCISKVEMENVEHRIVGEVTDQWHEFVGHWDNGLFRIDDNHRSPRRNPSFSTALQTFLSPTPWKTLDNAWDMSVKKVSHLMVAQNGPIYWFEFLASKEQWPEDQ
eukprot:PITA_28728